MSSFLKDIVLKKPIDQCNADDLRQLNAVQVDHLQEMQGHFVKMIDIEKGKFFQGLVKHSDRDNEFRIVEETSFSDFGDETIAQLSEESGQKICGQFLLLEYNRVRSLEEISERIETKLDKGKRIEIMPSEMEVFNRFRKVDLQLAKDLCGFIVILFDETKKELAKGYMTQLRTWTGASGKEITLVHELGLPLMILTVEGGIKMSRDFRLVEKSTRTLTPKESVMYDSVIRETKVVRGQKEAGMGIALPKKAQKAQAKPKNREQVDDNYKMVKDLFTFQDWEDKKKKIKYAVKMGNRFTRPEYGMIMRNTEQDDKSLYLMNGTGRKKIMQVSIKDPFHPTKEKLLTSNTNKLYFYQK